MPAFLAVILTAMITDNFVLSKFMGICPFLGVSKKLKSAVGMGIAVIFVMICSTLATYPFYHYILVPLGIDFLYNVGFILIIAIFVQLVEIILKKISPELHKLLGVYLPLITTNCAVLGVCIINVDNGLSFVDSILNSLGAGLGFTIALIVFSGVRGRIEHNDIPDAFKGIPSTLVAAAIMVIGFMGFSGMI
ncbi:MAG: RnfABCDGE type electron transport complex subunit A [Oscillospiraceae bacterium]|nr:RnfABCDGE type electron transport complex subunit A [Oscillospiraceae bacterium]